MDVSMQLRDLAKSVGEDFAMNAPDDTARLVGKARRGRMVWSTGVGAAVVGSAASLAFGGPALASVLTSGPAVAPAGSSTPSATASVSPTPNASVTPSPSTTPAPAPSTVAPLPSAGGNLGGVPAGVGGDDDSADDESHESGETEKSGDSSKTSDDQGSEHESEGSDD